MDGQITVIAEKSLPVCGCRKFGIDSLGDHVCTCTAHSVVKKAHDWVVDQFDDLFRTTHKVKTQQVVKSRGQYCGDIELAGYLANNNPNTISFMPAIASTSGRIHSEVIRILFLQGHRETDRFFASSGVQSA